MGDGLDRLVGAQLTWHWTHQGRPRLDDLTDEEYLWEVVEGGWSVRRREDATSALPLGAGATVIDGAWPPPEPPPFTTIAWRMGHLVLALGRRAATHFGTDEVHPHLVDWPLDAAGGVALLDEAYARWSDGVAGLDEAALLAPCGPAEGAFADEPMAGLVLHLNREVVHHLAEIALLRDLWRDRTDLR